MVARSLSKTLAGPSIELFKRVVIRSRNDDETARELTQGFFASLLEERGLATAPQVALQGHAATD
jgi:hypothetical protein